MKRFTHLNLNKNHIDSNKMQDMGPITLFERIRTWYSKLPEIHTRIRALELSQTQLNTFSMNYLVSLQQRNLLRLRILNLSQNKITDNGVEVLGNMLPADANLKYLDLSFNILGFKSIQILVDNLIPNKTMETLLLFGNDFQPNALHEFRRLFRKEGANYSQLKILKIGEIKNCTTN